MAGFMVVGWSRGGSGCESDVKSGKSDLFGAVLRNINAVLKKVE